MADVWGRTLVVLLVAGLLAASWVAVGRYRVEAPNRVVELVADYAGLVRLSQLANLADVPVETWLLPTWQQAGVTTLALPQTTIGDLAAEGKVTIVEGEQLYAWRRLGLQGEGALELLLKQEIRPYCTYLVVPLAEQGSEEIVHSIKTRFGQVLVGEPQRFANLALFELPLDREEVEEAAVGFPERLVEVVRRQGLLVAPRLEDFPGVGERYVNELFSRLRAWDNVSAVIFSGRRVLGYPELLPLTAAGLRRGRLRLGLIEFNPQLGSENLARQVDYQAVRVHGIPEEEMSRYNIDGAVERLARAVRERNIRVLYLRPFLERPPRQLTQYNLVFLERLRNRLHRMGFTLGKAQPFSDYHAGFFLTSLVFLGVLAAGLLLLREFLRIPIFWEIVLYMVGLCFLFIPVLREQGILARQMAALLAAVALPAIGLVREGRRFVGQPSSLGAKSYQELLLQTTAGFARVTGWSLAGCLLIIGALGDIVFMLKIEQFLGVKLMYTLPCVLAVFGCFLGRPLSVEQYRLVEAKIQRLAKRPVRLWHLAAGVALLVVTLVYLGRSGNAYLGALQLEDSLRSFLERLLTVRPRTKEFLLGHPALWLFLWRGLQGKRVGAQGLLLLGAVGQVSIVNTFCHVHTSLAVSLLRTAYGLLFGAIIGLLLVAVFAFVRYSFRHSVARVGVLRG